MSSPKDPQNQHIWRKASISDSSCPHKPVTVRASPLWCFIFVLSPSLHSNARRWPPWCTDRRRSSAWRSLTPGGNSRCENAWRYVWFKIKTNVYPLQFVHVDLNRITADKLVNMSPLSPQIPSFLVQWRLLFIQLHSGSFSERSPVFVRYLAPDVWEEERSCPVVIIFSLV